MVINTKFSNGDYVYHVWPYDWPSKITSVSRMMTIGQVRVEITNSPGREGEEMFDNYKPQHKYAEEYMCVETGIGSGTLYKVEDLFATKKEAESEAKRRNDLLEVV